MEHKAVVIFNEDGEAEFACGLGRGKELDWDMAQEHINDAVESGLPEAAKWKAVYMVAEVITEQPPCDNAHVAPGCELFA